VVGFEVSSLEHVVDSTWSTDDDLDTFLKLLSLVHDVGSSGTDVHRDLKVLSKAHYDSLNLLGEFSGWGKNESLASLCIRVNQLKDRDGEGGSLSGTRLSLSDSILALEDGEDTLGLDDGWLDEAVTIDTSEEVGLEVKSVERVDGFFPIGLDFSFCVFNHAVLVCARAYKRRAP